MKVEVAVLGSPSLIVLMVSVCTQSNIELAVNSELGCCVKVEVAVLGAYCLCGLKATLNLNLKFSESSGGV